MFNQHFKRNVLMEISIEHHLSYLTKQLTKTWRPGQVCAQRKHVNKKANERFCLYPRTIGYVGTYNDICLAAIAIEQRLEGCQQDHEQRYPFPLAQPVQLTHEILR